MTRAVSLSWTVGPSAGERIAPTQFVPARVPGAVQLDWARAHGWPPYWYGNHARDYAGLEDNFWTYRTVLPAVALAPDERCYLVAGGVDYAFRIRLDGVDVHTQEGMFTPVEIELTADAAARGAVLELVVFPAPKAPGPDDRRQARASVKPAVSYGWDFHPRLIPLGIWQETHLDIRPAAHLRDAELRYRLSDDFSTAEIAVAVETSIPAIGGRVHWTLHDPADEVVLEGQFAVAAPSTQCVARLVKPQLWWPIGQGAQPLYRFRAALLNAAGAVIHTRTQRVGFRRVRLVLPDEAKMEPAGFPKSRRPAPTTFEINGRKIFAQGSNWVSPEIFPGIVTAETYRPLVRLAAAAHFNILRAWGGAPVPKEAFFDQCDEAGLLVWQEFPLACNPYPDDPAYLRVLDQESRSIIQRVRRHACLALWSGGNELFNSWSGMDDQALPLRLLNRNCYELDPATPFIPTSPLEGSAHGDYRFRDEQGREVFALFAGANRTAYPEFGVPAPGPAASLREFLPPEELWPPRPGGAWERHHGFGAWELEPGSWLALDTQRHYFGEPPTLDELVARGDWLQSEGLKCLFEEARRQQPLCGMALNWCFNEPWPAAANNSLVHWPARPKPALAAVGGACRAILASARLAKFSWRAGEAFGAELWLLQNGSAPREALTVEARVHMGAVSFPCATWDVPASAIGGNQRGPSLAFTLPAAAGNDEFTLELSVAAHPEFDSRYRLHYKAAP